jgi:hypothetical protein
MTASEPDYYLGNNPAAKEADPPALGFSNSNASLITARHPTAPALILRASGKRRHGLRRLAIASWTLAAALFNRLKAFDRAHPFLMLALRVAVAAGVDGAVLYWGLAWLFPIGEVAVTR